MLWFVVVLRRTVERDSGNQTPGGLRGGVPLAVVLLAPPTTGRDWVPVVATG